MIRIFIFKTNEYNYMPEAFLSPVERRAGYLQGSKRSEISGSVTTSYEVSSQPMELTGRPETASPSFHETLYFLKFRMSTAFKIVLGHCDHFDPLLLRTDGHAKDLAKLYIEKKTVGSLDAVMTLEE